MTDHEHEVLVWLTSRTIAMTLYGAMGIEVGAATLAAGGPPIVDDWPVTRLIIGLLALIGGLLTVAGSLIGDRREPGWWVALAGTTLMASWMVVVGTAYFLITVRDGIVFSLPWQPVPPSLGRLYIPLLYQSILFLIVLHIVTLLRLGRPSKR